MLLRLVLLVGALIAVPIWFYQVRRRCSRTQWYVGYLAIGLVLWLNPLYVTTLFEYTNDDDIDIDDNWIRFGLDSVEALGETALMTCCLLILSSYLESPTIKLYWMIYAFAVSYGCLAVLARGPFDFALLTDWKTSTAACLLASRAVPFGLLRRCIL